MDTDFTTIKPIWYIDVNILVTTLQALKDLGEDPKRKIIRIITLSNKRQEERYNIINYNFFDTSDYYFSEESE